MAGVIGRSGGKPGKQGKSKWDQPVVEVKAVEKPVIPVPEEPAQQAQAQSTEKKAAEVKAAGAEKAADQKSDKAKEKKAKSKSEQKNAQALVDLLKKDKKSTGGQKSIYFTGENLEFLEMLKKKNNIQYSAVINMLIGDFRKKYTGFLDAPDEAEDE